MQCSWVLTADKDCQRWALNRICILALLASFFLLPLSYSFIFSLRSVIDLLTCIPMFVSFGAPTDTDTQGIFIVRILRVIRILRVARLIKMGKHIGVEIQQRIFYLAFSIVSMVLIAAGIFYELERRYSDWVSLPT